MALTGTDRGTGANGSSEASTVMSPASTIAAGSMGVLVIAADNANGASTNFPASINDSVGNTWTRRIDRTSGAANTNVENVLYTSEIGTQVTSSNNVTVTYSSANVTAKAWTFTEIAPGAGNIVMLKTFSNSSSSNTASPTVVTGTLVAVGDLVLGGGGAESGDTWTGDSDTTNGSWSTMQHNGTGSGATGISVISQYKVLTAAGTQQSYDPTLTIADVAVLYAIFAEVPAKTRAISASTTTDASNTVTIRKALTAGSVGVLCIAADNAGTNGSTQNLPTTCPDSKSNTWTLWNGTVSGIFDNGTASQGVEIGIYTCVLTTGLVVDDTITITYAIASVAAKAWVVFEFSDATGLAASGVGTGATTTTPSVTTSSISSPDYVIGITGLEGTDTFTDDADSTNGSWSTGARASAGSTGASAMTLHTQYKKVNASGAQTYNPTCTSGDTMIGWAELTVPSTGLNAQQKAAFFMMFN